MLDQSKYNNIEVRRQDRLLSPSAATDLLNNGEFAFLAMVETRANQKAGYGIPINFVWDKKDSIYFHCAPEGHKINCLDAHPLVTLSVVGKTEVIPHKFTTNYSSIIVRGEVTCKISEDERHLALELLIKKYSPSNREIGLKYIEKSFHRTRILKLKIESVSGKCKKINP